MPRLLCGTTRPADRPTRGVYFLTSRARSALLAIPESCKLETHALTATPRTTLWPRLSQHCGHLAGLQPRAAATMADPSSAATTAHLAMSSRPRRDGLGIAPNRTTAVSGLSNSRHVRDGHDSTDPEALLSQPPAFSGDEESLGPVAGVKAGVKVSQKPKHHALGVPSQRRVVTTLHRWSMVLLVNRLPRSSRRSLAVVVSST